MKSNFLQRHSDADHRRRQPLRRRLLLIVIFRFNEKANPTPSQLTHHTGLEVAWTILPVLILVFIAIPSFRLLDHELVDSEGRYHSEGHGPSVVLDL